MQELAQDPDFLHLFRDQQQLLAAGAGTVDVDRGVGALFGQPAVEVDLHVAGALELFVNHVIHLRAGVDQGGGEDGQRAALLDVARRAEEALGPLQGIGVHAAGQHLAGGRHDGVVGAGETGDGVEQDDDILFVLDQALGLLDHHLRDLHVPAGRFVEGGADDLAAHRALHLGDFFRALVDKQHDQVDIGVIGGKRVSDVLQHHGLAGLGRRDDQAALSLADRRDQVNHARGQVFAGGIVAFEAEALLRMERGEVLEQDLVLGLFRVLEIDFVDLEQGEVAFAFLRRADRAAHGVAGAQVETADLRGADVDVVRAGEVRGIGGAQKAEAVLQDLHHAFAHDVFTLLGLGLEDGEDQILLAQAGAAFHFEGGRHFGEFSGGFTFEFGQVHESRGQAVIVKGGGVAGLPEWPTEIIDRLRKNREMDGSGRTRCFLGCRETLAPATGPVQYGPVTAGRPENSLRRWET